MSFKAALIQMRSGVDMARNLSDASSMIREAAAQGAQYVLTPEVTNIFEADRQRLRAVVATEQDDASVAGFSRLAQELGIWLHAGSLALRLSEDKLVNRSLLFAPDGTVAARYDKIHLFDVDMPSGERIRESDFFAPGGEAVVAATSLGAVGPQHLLRHAFSQTLQCVGQCGCRCSWRCPRPLPCPRGRPIGMFCCARGPLKPGVLCLRRRRAAPMKAAGTRSATVWWSIHGERSSPSWERNPGFCRLRLMKDW